MQRSIERALEVLAGGCDSPVRSGWSARLADVRASFGRGRLRVRRIGPALHRLRDGLGAAALRAHASRTGHRSRLAGRAWLVWGTTHGEEIRLAERIRAYLPSMQRMRFVTTGTEAMMSAVRVARAFTGRSRILKFAGNYHGHFDPALIDAGASAGAGGGGIPQGVRADVLVARYNDLASVDDASRRRRNRPRRDNGRTDRGQHGSSAAGRWILGRFTATRSARRRALDLR